MITIMKWYENMLVLAAGIPLIIGVMLAVTVIFLGACLLVFFRRTRNVLTA